MEDKTITLDPDAVSNLRLYLDLCEMYYRGRRGPQDGDEYERRFAEEHIQSIAGIRKQLNDRA